VFRRFIQRPIKLTPPGTSTKRNNSRLGAPRRNPALTTVAINQKKMSVTAGTSNAKKSEQLSRILISRSAQIDSNLMEMSAGFFEASKLALVNTPSVK
jgi:hypothetical protein